MKFTVALLCAVLLQYVGSGCSFAQEKAQYELSDTSGDNYLLNDAVRIDQVKWWYAQPNHSNAAAAEITISNHSDKQIKRIDFNIVATDSAGLVLESEGFAIKKLVATDSVAPHTSRTFNFDKAFFNENVSTLEVNDAIVEYDNGSIDVLRKKR